MPEFITAIAALAGLLIGYWLRSAAAKKERQQLEQRLADAAGNLASLRADLVQAQSLAGDRAGFESLSGERAKTIDQLTADRDSVRSELQSRMESERVQCARLSALEAELNNERQNLAEKLALLESAKQSLANQFQALAGEILDSKSKSFAEGSQKELGNLLAPLHAQISEFRKKVEEAQSDSKTGVTRLETLIGTLGSHQPATHGRSPQSLHRAARLRQSPGRLGRIHSSRPAREGRVARRRAVHVSAVFRRRRVGNRGTLAARAYRCRALSPRRPQPGDRFQGVAQGLHRLRERRQ